MVRLRYTSAQGYFASSRKTVEEKINGVTLLVEREKYGKKIFKHWTCNEYGHYASKCPKRENKFKGRFRRPRNFLYANEEEEEDESDKNMSEDEL